MTRQQPAPVRSQLAALAALVTIPLGCTGNVLHGPAEQVTFAACNPGEPVVRRLGPEEYNQSLEQLLGDTSRPGDLFPSETSATGFRTGIGSGSLGGATLLASYQQAAQTAATRLMADPARRDQVIGCDLRDEANRQECVDAFIRRFGGRAYRRPLDDDEYASLRELARSASASTDPYASAQRVIEGVLQAPQFLYRVELGTPAGSLRKLTGYEVATRLSFALWGQPPGPALLAAAQEGSLQSAERVEALAREMLHGGRTEATVDHFTEDWLGLGWLEQAQRDPERFPLWNEQLRSAMHTETLALMREIAFGGSLLDVFTTRYTYLNKDLATLYGVEPPQSGWQWAELPDDAFRSGVLTQPALLTGSANGDIAPIRRGLLISTAFLCQELRPPDDIEIPPLSDSEGDATSEREIFEQHRSSPACASCHEYLDNLGFALEQYDAIGQYRSQDNFGNELTGQSRISVFARPEFAGAQQLGQRLRQAPEVTDCLTRQVFRHIFGRHETKADSCTLERARQAFVDSGHSYKELVIALVTSEAFLYRQGWQ